MNLWLHEPELRTTPIQVPNLEDPIALNLIIYKGIMAVSPGRDGFVRFWNTASCDNICHGRARLFEVKHFALADFSRYREMLKQYYHIASANTYNKLKSHLKSLYDGIVDGEIVTLVFFIPEQDLLDGTATETKNSQSS